DSGVGIPDSFKQRLFTPFSQADGSMTRRHGGTGLGLSITRRLLQLLDGELALDSVVGRGTWIRLRLRVRPIEAPAETAPVGKACTPTQELHAHVLLVDDAPDNLRLVSRILTKAGAVVDTAENGRIACDKVLAASAGAQPFDLIIMDVQMPDMDGCMATRLLRQHGVRTPIVALTAHAMAEDRQRCLDAGYDDYETKPIDRPRLLATLLRHVPPPATPV
ncbi:MAG TPA: response regulator, partial [Planctomycetota bacterium]|nr:response regulator [Planctomycetota bacterium]